MWRWFRWVLLSIGFIIVLLVGLFFIIRPSSKNIPIAAYQDPQCERTFAPQFNAASYYQGPLFDTHFHIPPDHGSSFNKFGVILQKDLTLSQIVCEFQKEKVVGAIAFYAPNAWLMASLIPQDEITKQWLEQAKEIKKGLPDWIHLLYDPLTEDKTEAQKAYDTGIFDGFGEMVFLKGESPRPGSKVNDEVSLAVEKIANDHKLVITVHPEEKDKDQLEDALQQNPNAIFIIHSWGHDDYVSELMDKYPNFYFTLDPTTFIYKTARYIQGPEDKFITSFKQNFNANLADAVRQWQRPIERHPDRFMWGTDRCFKFHYSEEVGKLYEEFARAFLGSIDLSSQEAIAYKNAQNIFTKGLQPQIKTNQNSNNQNNDGGNLNGLPQSVQSCIINQITRTKWEELSNHTRPATAQEEEIIGRCSRQ